MRKGQASGKAENLCGRGLDDGRFLRGAARQGDVGGGGYAGNDDECSEIDGGRRYIPSFQV